MLWNAALDTKASPCIPISNRYERKLWNSKLQSPHLEKSPAFGQFGKVIAAPQLKHPVVQLCLTDLLGNSSWVGCLIFSSGAHKKDVKPLQAINLRIQQLAAVCLCILENCIRKWRQELKNKTKTGHQSGSQPAVCHRVEAEGQCWTH